MNIKSTDNWKTLSLDKIQQNKNKTISPNKTGNQMFELYSVPSHKTNQPEIVSGYDIGSNKQTVEEGTVLLCKINPHINRVWIVGNYSSFPKIASTEWIPFFKQDDIDPKYLFYFFQNINFRNFLCSNTSGIGGSLTRIKPSILSQYTISIPSLPIQKKIIQKLDHIFKEFEDKKKKISELQEKNQERVKYLDEKLADDTIDQIIHFNNPEKNWLCGTVDEFKGKKYILKYQDGNHGELHPKKSDFSETGVPFITAKQIDIKGNVILDGCKRLPEKFHQILRIGFTEPNDVLFTHNAIVGRVGILPSSAPPSIIGTSVTYYRLDPKKIYNKYFYYLLRSKFIRNQYESIMKQTTRNQFSKLKQAKLNLIIPPLTDQIKLVKTLENLFIKMNEFSPRIKHLRNSYKKITEDLDFVQKSILTQVFSEK